MQHLNTVTISFSSKKVKAEIKSKNGESTVVWQLFDDEGVLMSADCMKQFCSHVSGLITNGPFSICFLGKSRFLTNIIASLIIGSAKIEQHIGKSVALVEDKRKTSLLITEDLSYYAGKSNEDYEICYAKFKSDTE